MKNADQPATNNKMEKATITGYKVTDKNLQCRGFQFEVGKKYTQSGNLSICNNGFHFCEQVEDCFEYYSFDSNNRILIVEALSDVQTDGNKSCTLDINIVKEITWGDMLVLANKGADNTGLRNAGNRNAGNRNAGNYNAGNDNAGNYNAGNYNAGNRNAGNYNAGYANAGNYNAGNYNAGNRNAGNYNAGYANAGYDNAGNYNAGNRNAGYANAGNANAGNYNAGNYNAGNRNAGNYNAGNDNAGNYNAGNYNAGNRNAGYANAGNDNAGAFNSVEAPYMMFNKPSKWKHEDFISSKAYSLLQSVETTLYVWSSSMTDEEKKVHPYHVTTGGFVKNIPFKEAFQNSWHNWSAENRAAFTSLPNFSKKVFEEITGVKA